MKKNKHEFSGYLDDCSPEQIETLAKFRQEVRDMDCPDPPYDDAYLLRFLRARKFDLPKTMIMWKNFIAWRKEKNIDDIMNMKFPEIEEAKNYYPHGYYLTDKSGRPIYIERIGQLKFDQLVKTISIERLQLYFIQSYERLVHEIFPGCSREKGQRVEQTCYILDLKGVGVTMFSKMREIVKVASYIGQNYYPEILGTMYIINTPMFFYGVWNVVKHFIDDKTKKKVQILDSGYQKVIHEVVDVANLPDFLGGKQTPDDYGKPFCTEKGPWLKNDEKEFKLLTQPNEKQLIESDSVNNEPERLVIEDGEVERGQSQERSQNQEEKKAATQEFVRLNSEENRSAYWDVLEVAEENTKINEMDDFSRLLKLQDHHTKTQTTRREL